MTRHPITGSTLLPSTGSGWHKLSRLQTADFWTMVGQERLAAIEEHMAYEGWLPEYVATLAKFES